MAALAVFACAVATPALAAPAAQGTPLALVPPMGWNDWAHYQCGFTASTILYNAHALVDRGLAAAGYNTVTIDDCWMQKDRDASGNLQADPQRFPQGIESVVQSVHSLGLKFGIYEDAGYSTCAGFAGSGQPKGGGHAHFLQDASPEPPHRILGVGTGIFSGLARLVRCPDLGARLRAALARRQ